MTDHPRIAALLEKLYNPHLKYIDLSLERIERFLALLDNPQRRLPPVIHIAGTNGKGSLVANLQAIFEAAGLRVHRNISPHLVRFNERIVIAGKDIEDDYLETLLRRVLALNEQQPVTFFEATTAAAFIAFSEHPADVVLLEVGLGGRLDATNVIAAPTVTAITPVALDHCKNLGGTIAAIAREKAGIIKRGAPCVTGRQTPEAMAVIASQAQVQGAPLYRMGVDWEWRRENETAIYISPKRRLAFAPSLAGAHQYDNAATAIACIDRLPSFQISDVQIAQGIASTRWPGRLQKLTAGTYRALLPPHMELWLDGGHNPQGGEVLADWLKAQRKEAHLICGMVKGKDSAGYFKPLAPLTASCQTIAIPDEPDSQPPESLREAAAEAGIPAEAAPSLEKALQTLAGRAKTPSIACICGSLYLAGRVLATNEA